jgi:outer membrane protein OmpA-like peptidoglycan-associated protein
MLCKGGNARDCNIYACHVDKNGKIGKPILQSFHNNGTCIGHPTLSSDGKVMFYTAMRGKGKSDLCMVRKIGDDEWTKPLILNCTIKTDKEECYPYLYRDSILFFSSNGHLGMGGLDIFYTKISLDGVTHAVSGNTDLSRLNFSKPVNLGAPINSSADDVSMLMSADETGGFFISNRTENQQNKNNIYSFSGMPYVLNDLDVALPDFNAIQAKRNPWDLPLELKEIETKASPFLSHAYDPNTQTYYVTQRLQGSKNPGIYAYRADNNGKLHNAKPMKQSFHDDNAAIAHPTLSSNGKVMVYNSTKDNQADLYMVRKIGENTWTTPVKISSNVNTDKDECFPQLFRDSVLFFSSDGHGGMGKLDVFYSKITLDGATHSVSGNSDLNRLKFTDPVNLGVPINTIDDDILRLIELDGKDAFAVLTRPNNAQDKDNIYDFLQRLFVFDDPARYITEPLPAKGSKNPQNEKAVLQQYHDAQGAVELMVAKHFFDTDKHHLKPESVLELARLVDVLKQNPEIRIEIIGHTDNTGSESYNQPLSERRAKSVYDFLIGQGIAANRLQHTGHGLSRPIAPNDSVFGRSQNRRVEIKFL